MDALEKLVSELSDGYQWNWTQMASRRDAADEVLGRMSELGLIHGREHQFGGMVWTVNGRQYGRVK